MCVNGLSLMSDYDAMSRRCRPWASVRVGVSLIKVAIQNVYLRGEVTCLCMYILVFRCLGDCDCASQPARRRKNSGAGVPQGHVLDPSFSLSLSLLPHLPPYNTARCAALILPPHILKIYWWLQNCKIGRGRWGKGKNWKWKLLLRSYPNLSGRLAKAAANAILH